jgi:hypothetical protein
MASKRPADGEASGAQPPFKKVQFESFRIGPVSTLEEMDIKVLQFKNKKLAQVNFFVCQINPQTN